MNETSSDACADLPARDRRNRNTYLLLLALAMLVYLAGAAWIVHGTLPSPAWAWIIAAASSLLSLLAARAYWRFVHEADELVRSVELKALALAVCGGFVIWIGVDLLAKSGVSTAQWPNPVMMTMVVLYALGVWNGWRTYR